MEKKLEEYRTQKRRQAFINNIKERFYNMVSFQQVANTSKKDHVIVEDLDKSTKNVGSSSDELCSGTDYSDEDCSDSNLPDNSDIDIEESDTDSKLIDDTESKWFRYITYFLYFLFWVTCYAIAIQLQFGIVYLLLSAIFGIYFNTRTGKRNKNEISAYSVFNEDCHRIDGTISAEQFENELRYGAMK